MIINNHQVKNFTKDEFSESIRYALPELIINLDLLRDIIGGAIYPSPVKGALARFDDSKTSQHYAVDRLSTAIDVFIDKPHFECYTKILQSNLFLGVGFYPNWNYKEIRGGWHLDLRDSSLIWFRDVGEYTYSYQKGFYERLHKYLK